MRPSTDPQVNYTLITKYAKMGAKCEKQKIYSGVFCVPFFAFHVSQHFAQGSAFTRKIKGFCDLFFHGINKIWNLHEMRKVYSQPHVYWKGSLHLLKVGVHLSCLVSESLAQPSLTRRLLLWIITDFITLLECSEVNAPFRQNNAHPHTRLETMQFLCWSCCRINDVV